MHTLGLRFTGTAKNVVSSTVTFSGINSGVIEGEKRRNQSRLLDFAGSPVKLCCLLCFCLLCFLCPRVNKVSTI